MVQASNQLSIDGLSVNRGALQVLHSINLQIGPEPVVMLGRNGAGKSTLCAALLGLLPTHDGSFSLNGVTLTHKKVHEIAQSGLALVPQGRRVFPSLTVHEHLQLFKGQTDDVWTTDRIYETFPRLAERCRNYGNQLSGGEQQMLAIGRALMTNPKLLILDEPSEGLAPKIVQDLISVLCSLPQHGIQVFLIEQNWQAGIQVADRVVILENGQIALETDAETLKDSPNLQRQYLGIKTMRTA